MIVVPTFQNKSSRYSFDMELNQELFHLVFTFNARESSWYMNIQDQNENDIITGIKMVINYLLLEQYKAYVELPQGDFVVLDLEQNPATGGITFNNFGFRYQLVFFTNYELDTGDITVGF